MKSRMSHFRLGIFIIVAIAILVVLAVSVGGGNLLRPKVTVETYFDESVQGLDVGSKVRYRGVVIGQVSRITFTYTKYELNKPPADRKQYVLVEMAVYPDLLGKVGQGQQFVDQLVEDGLRIRMAPIGVTGVVYLEVDFTKKDKSDMLAINWAPQYIYIPSARSTVVTFVEAAERFMAKLEPLDIEKTARNIDHLLTTLNQKAEGLDTGKLSKDMSGALAELQGTLRDVRQLTSQDEWKRIPKDLATTAQRLRQIAESPELERTLTALDRTTTQLSRALDGREGDISELIVNLRSASTNLKALSENLRRDPAGTLLSRPPKPVDVYAPR